jgi:hypothetical protein
VRACRLPPALALSHLGGEPQHRLRICFNGRMAKKFPPLHFQSLLQPLPAEPHGRDELVASARPPGSSSWTLSPRPRPAGPHEERECRAHDAASVWPEPDGSGFIGLHSARASARSPCKASARSRRSSLELESSCLNSVIRCWIAACASPIRRGKSPGQSSSRAARYSSRQTMVVITVTRFHQTREYLLQ